MPCSPVSSSLFRFPIEQSFKGAIVAKNNKVYFPVDALSRREDFDVWYEDGELFYHLEGDWSEEKSRIALMGRLGGETASIKPDFKSLSYYLREGLHTYSLTTHRIFRHYYIEGMIWEVYGSMRNPPFDFITVDRNGRNKRDAHVRVVKFRDKGYCYEVSVVDIEKLRIATVSAIAIGIKEEHKGDSRGEDLPKDAPRLERIKRRIFTSGGFTFDEMVAKDPEIARIAALNPHPFSKEKTD